MAQVANQKINTIQPSKNLGTVINTQVSGKVVNNAKLEYRKLTDVQSTQISGKCHNTNYMGINTAGMDIRAAKKITGDELNVNLFTTAYIAKDEYILDANNRLEEQEYAQKHKTTVEDSTDEGNVQL